MGGPANLYRPLTQHEKEEKIEEKLTLEESCLLLERSLT